MYKSQCLGHSRPTEHQGEYALTGALNDARNMMRRILVDRARAKGTAKRGSAALHRNLDEAPEVASGSGDGEIAAIDEALQALGQFDPRKEKGGRAASFRRAERRGDRRCPEDLSAVRHARLEACPGPAARKALMVP